MDVVQAAALTAATFLVGSLGFVLSVLAALLQLLLPYFLVFPPPDSPPPPARPQPRPIQSAPVDHRPCWREDRRENTASVTSLLSHDQSQATLSSTTASVADVPLHPHPISAPPQRVTFSEKPAAPRPDVDAAIEFQRARSLSPAPEIRVPRAGPGEIRQGLVAVAGPSSGREVKRRHTFGLLKLRERKARQKPVRSASTPALRVGEESEGEGEGKGKGKERADERLVSTPTSTPTKHKFPCPTAHVRKHIHAQLHPSPSSNPSPNPSPNPTPTSSPPARTDPYAAPYFFPQPGSPGAAEYVRRLREERAGRGHARSGSGSVGVGEEGAVQPQTQVPAQSSLQSQSQPQPQPQPQNPPSQPPSSPPAPQQRSPLRKAFSLLPAPPR